MAFHKRSDLHAIAVGKIGDAQFLFDNGRFSNAYYLAGYAIEIGLKACIAKQISAEVLPDRNFITAIFVHDLKRLVSLAGLERELKNREANDPRFAASWAITVEWAPDIRYVGVDRASAQQLLYSISDNDVGVLPWIKQYW